MTDRELLEAAARAAGIQFDESPRDRSSFDALGNAVLDWHNGTTWNPLTDDGDALRLAVRLGLVVAVMRREPKPFTTAYAFHCDCRADQSHGQDEYAATRRAIVRAAAACAPEAKR